MRDITINEIADKIAVKYFLPKRFVRKLVNHMFKHIFKVIGTGTDRVLLWRSPLRQIYTDYDVKKMCQEMIDGKRKSYTDISQEKLTYANKKSMAYGNWHLYDN